MEEFANIKVLFVAGFGPIVRDTEASGQLYRETLGISFKEESGGYFHTEALAGAKTFALWPLDQAAQSCFGSNRWPDDIPVPQAWLEFDVENVEQATANLELQGFQMLVKSKKEPWARRSAGSSLRKDCWSESPSLRRCEKNDNLEIVDSRAISSCSG